MEVSAVDCGPSPPPDDALEVDRLRHELLGACALADFRLRRISDLQDELLRLRRLVLTMRGGSESLRRWSAARPDAPPALRPARSPSPALPSPAPSGGRRKTRPSARTASLPAEGVARPTIRLHTGVRLCGPKTFRRAPPEPPHETRDAPSGPWRTTGALRSAHEGAREALAMLRGRVLRADRALLSALTTLSNRRAADCALPAALAALRQTLIRARPALAAQLRDGEAWRLDARETDALEVAEVAGAAAALRDVVVAHDYTMGAMLQHVLRLDDAPIALPIGRAFQELYSNLYILLAMAQCPTTDTPK